MIDAHCHLEQDDYHKDRDIVIKKCKEAGLKALVTSCAHPEDFQLTIDMVDRYRGYVFAALGIHPGFIKELEERQVEDFLALVKKNKDRIVAIGEVGLDYKWVKEERWRDRQKELFRRLILFSKDMRKPLVIHARDAYGDVIDMLEKENAEHVMLHMFGANELVQRVLENGWHVSMNAIVLRSKKHKKVVRDMPLERLMLETDSPWLAPEGWESKRNDPRTIKIVAEKIAEIKGLDFVAVWEACGRNAVKFFSLKI
jgi:TatD DNase family protein